MYGTRLKTAVRTQMRCINLIASSNKFAYRGVLSVFKKLRIYKHSPLWIQVVRSKVRRTSIEG